MNKDMSKVTEDALRARVLLRVANSVACMNCNRIMTVFESDRGVCPSCGSNAVYPALPGHVVKADNVPDVRRVG